MTRMDAIYAVYRSLPEDAQKARDGAARRVAEKKLTEARADKPDLMSPIVWICELTKKSHELWLWQMEQDFGQDIAAMLSGPQSSSSGASWMSWTREELQALKGMVIQSVPLKVLPGGVYDKSIPETHGYWQEGRE